MTDRVSYSEKNRLDPSVVARLVGSSKKRVLLLSKCKSKEKVSLIKIFQLVDKPSGDDNITYTSFAGDSPSRSA